MADLESLLDRLIAHQVQFVLVGGFAAVAHGASLMTQDVDICLDFGKPNLKRFLNAMDGLSPTHRMTPRNVPLGATVDSIADLKNMYLQTDLGQLDCLSAVIELGDFESVKAKSIVVELNVGQCRILELGALIKSKEALGRPRDRQAVLMLKAIQDMRDSD